MFGEHISNSQILQESERHINIKEFDADFLEIFQNNMEDKNTEYDLDNDNSTFLITESAFNTNLNFGNIVARAQKRNAALNTNKRQNLTKPQNPVRSEDNWNYYASIRHSLLSIIIQSFLSI